MISSFFSSLGQGVVYSELRKIYRNTHYNQEQFIAELHKHLLSSANNIRRFRMSINSSRIHRKFFCKPYCILIHLSQKATQTTKEKFRRDKQKENDTNQLLIFSHCSLIAAGVKCKKFGIFISSRLPCLLGGGRFHHFFWYPMRTGNGTTELLNVAAVGHTSLHF